MATKKTEEVKAVEKKAEKPVAAKTKKAAETVKKAPAKAKAAVKATAKKAEDKVVAEKIEVKKTAAGVKKAPAKAKAAVKVEKAVKKSAAKVKAAKLEIYVQSPLGGNITPEEIAAKVPKGADTVFVRVDQNKLWWIMGEESGSVDIW